MKIKNLEYYLTKTHFTNSNQIEKAFKLCKTKQDIEAVCNHMKYNCKNAFGTFTYIIENDKQFTVTRMVPAFDEFDIDFTETMTFNFYKEDID